MITFKKSELEYIKKAITSFKETDDSSAHNIDLNVDLIDKIGYELDRVEDLYKTYEPFIAFLMSNPEYKTESYTFITDLSSPSPTVQVSGTLIDDFEVVSSVKELNEIESVYTKDTLRICDICGAPMESGFTDEDSYICCDIEFHDHMQSLYPDGWRAATQEEEKKYEACYMYNEDGIMKPSGWYYTEWY